MGKHDRRTSRRQPSTSRSVSIQVPLPVLAVLGDVRQAFHGLCISTGMQVLQAMQEADRDALCGPKGRHQSERTAWRGGSVESHVTLGGRQVGLPRLRVRDAGGEVPLASFQWAAATDALEAHTLEAIAAGVSTRRYGVDPVPWRPILLARRRRSPRCRSRDRRTRRQSDSRWSSWFGPDVNRESWLGSSSRRPRRSASGSRRLIATLASAPTD